MHYLNAFLIAFSTYSRIPVPRADWNEENRRCALCFFPLVGAALALALWLWTCLARGRSGLLFAAGAALLPLLVTGGIHMDGLMDTADALASHAGPERRLEILKDSRAGAFAVMACAGYLLAQTALWGELGPERVPLILPGYAASRALSAMAAVCLRPARREGMLAGFTKTAPKGAVMASGLACLALCLGLWAWLGGTGYAALMALILAGCLLIYRLRAYRDFGGVTGDLAGAFLEMTELCLLAAAALWRG